MISLITRFIPLPWLLLGLTGIGFASGAWITTKVYKAGEVRALESTISDLKSLRRADMKTLKRFYADQLAIERGKAREREVLRYVKDNRNCDLPEPVRRLLDARRQGVPEATGRTTEDTRDPPADGPVSQSQALAGHFDLAGRNTSCRQQLIRLNEWYQQHG